MDVSYVIIAHASGIIKKRGGAVGPTLYDNSEVSESSFLGKTSFE